MTESQAVYPHSEEAERAYLGALILERRILHRGLGLVKRDELYREVHRIIYDVLEALEKAHAPVDPVAVVEELRKRGQLEAVGGISYVMGLTHAVPLAEQVEYYAAQVVEKARLRGTLQLMEEAARRGRDPAANSEELLSFVQAGLNTVSRRRRAERFSLLELAHIGDGRGKSIIEDLEERRRLVEEKGRCAVGLQTGMDPLDTRLGGLQEGIHILAAQPGAGKTTLSLQWCRYIAVNSGVPCLFVSFDESLLRLGLKMICGYGRLNSKRHYEGMEDLDPVIKAAQEMERFSELIHFMQGTHHLSPRGVGGMAEDIMEQAGADRILIVIDYLQAWAEAIQGGDEYKRRDFRFVVDGLLRELREESLVLHVPILVISSQARGNQDKAGWTAKESSGIEYTADTFMNLITDKDRTVTNGRGVKLTIEKNRYGDVCEGGILIDFYPAQGYMAANEH